MLARSCLRISTRADTRQWPTHLKHQASSDGFEQDNRVQLAFNPHGVMRALAAAAWAFLPLQHALADVPAQSGGVDVFAEAMKEVGLLTFYALVEWAVKLANVYIVSGRDQP
jgi:hypothetical protein